MNNLDKILKRLGNCFYKLSPIEKAAIYIAYTGKSKENTDSKLSLVERAAMGVVEEKASKKR